MRDLVKFRFGPRVEVGMVTVEVYVGLNDVPLSKMSGTVPVVVTGDSFHLSAEVAETAVRCLQGCLREIAGKGDDDGEED